MAAQVIAEVRTGRPGERPERLTITRRCKFCGMYHLHRLKVYPWELVAYGTCTETKNVITLVLPDRRGWSE